MVQGPANRPAFDPAPSQGLPAELRERQGDTVQEQALPPKPGDAIEIGWGQVHSGPEMPGVYLQVS